MAVSPDGRRLLDVTHGTPGGLNAYLGPFWSPDGERLAFTVVDAPDQPPGTIPYVVYVTQFGGHVRQLTRAQIYRGAWAPDGNRIAYTYVDRGRATIRLLDVRRERTHFLHAGASPSWSPDGRRIAFVEDGRVSVMNADGTGVVRLTG
jgi:Tol biopolymer transport system component